MGRSETSTGGAIWEGGGGAAPPTRAAPPPFAYFTNRTVNGYR